MTPLLPVIAIIIVSILFITGRNATTKKQVLGNSTTPTESASPSATLEETPLISPMVTVIQSTNTPTPSSPPTNNQTLESSWKYPNSTQGGGNDSNFESTDDPKTITDWYKSKIRGLGYSTKSFVSTSSNGKVLNKLVGANNNQEVRIEIKKEQDNNIVKISVRIS